MAGRGAAAARHRPLHGVRRAHARSEDRRSGADARARTRLLLYRRARLAEDARPARRAAEGAGHHATTQLARIHAPIGLAIGAVSPPEIAVAIMGEITARLRLTRGGRAMKFGAVPPREAEGAIAVHSIRKGGTGAQEGHADRPGRDRRAGGRAVSEIVVARLEPGDVSEDEAAAEIAAALPGEGVRVDRAFTGRGNLFAEHAGVLVVDKDGDRSRSTASTRRSPSRRCRPTSRSSPAR